MALTSSKDYNNRVFFRLVIHITVISVFSSSILFSQEKPRTGRKPVLVRADPEEDQVEEEIIVHDPVQAKKSVEIGDFYLKRDNFEAAEQRYREAIQYNLKWDKSYKKLIKLLEKQEDFQAAIEVCKEFIQNNPTSKEVKDFEKTEEKLKEKLNNS